MNQFFLNLILMIFFGAVGVIGVWFFGSKAWETRPPGCFLVQRVEKQQAQPHQSAQGTDITQQMSTGNNSTNMYIKEQKIYMNPIKDDEVVNNIVNIPNALGNENVGPGWIMEGRRSNILEKDCIEKIVERNPSIAKIEMSPVAPDFKQAAFHLKPKDIVNIEFNGIPVLLRKDYTFSFIIYSKSQNIRPNVSFTIQSDTGEVPSSFDFNGAVPYQNVKLKNIKTFRPQVASFFPEVPHFLKGTIRITNPTVEPIDIAIVLPVIEEGLFASSPTVCGTTRNAEFLSYLSKGNLPKELDNGTIFFMFSPYWDASRLTPGIDPHFFSWTDEKAGNGIKIIADSKDHGKIKAAIMKNGKVTLISSDITPLKGELYPIAFRFQKGKADLIIKGNNRTFGENISFPDVSKLTDKFYVGCNPLNEDEAAFSVIKKTAVFDRFLNDEEVKTVLNNFIKE